MNIEHELYGAQVKYGYIWWHIKDEEKFKQVLPKGKFILYFGKEKIRKCKADWARHRFSIGPSVMKNHFKKDDKIMLSNPSGTKVVISKKYHL